MAIPAEYLRAARKWGPELDRVAASYRNPATGRPLSGTALLLKLYKGESGFSLDALSDKGARGPGQFMPGTRKAVLEATDNKVDPWRSVDEAMQASVMHLTGKLGHRKGLEGYNPGGGQDYVNYILGQKIGDVGASRRGGQGGPSGGGSGSTTTTIPGGTQTVQLPGAPQLDLTGLLSRLEKPARPQPMGVAAPRFAAGQQFSAASIPPSPSPARSGQAETLAAILASAQAPPSTREYQMPGVTTTTNGGSGGAVSTNTKGKSPLFEMFYNGPGGINVDQGKRVPKGYVSGHTGHVHVAAGPKTVDRLGRLAQRMGLRVAENETFDRVDPVHTKGSFHYRDRAIDVSGDPRKLRQFNRRVAQLYGLAG